MSAYPVEKIHSLINESYEYLRLFENDFLLPCKEATLGYRTKTFFTSSTYGPDHMRTIYEQFNKLFTRINEIVSPEQKQLYRVLLTRARDILEQYKPIIERLTDDKATKVIKQDRILLEGLAFIATQLNECIKPTDINLYDNEIDDAFTDEPKFVRLWNRKLMKVCCKYVYKDNVWYYLYNPVNGRWYTSQFADFSNHYRTRNQPEFYREYMIVYDDRGHSTFINSVSNENYAIGKWLNGIVKYGQYFSYYIDNDNNKLYVANNDLMEFSPVLNADYNINTDSYIFMDEYYYNGVAYLMLQLDEKEFYIFSSKVPAIAIRVSRIPIYNKEAYLLYNGMEFGVDTDLD